MANIVRQQCCSFGNLHRAHALHQTSQHCSWSTAAVLPSLIDLSSSCGSLLQTFRIGEYGSLKQDFMNQLRLLMFTRDDIFGHKEADMLNAGKEPVYRCYRVTDMDELLENVNKRMTKVSGFRQMAHWY